MEEWDALEAEIFLEFILMHEEENDEADLLEPEYLQQLLELLSLEATVPHKIRILTLDAMASHFDSQNRNMILNELGSMTIVSLLQKLADTLTNGCSKDAECPGYLESLSLLRIVDSALRSILLSPQSTERFMIENAELCIQIGVVYRQVVWVECKERKLHDQVASGILKVFSTISNQLNNVVINDYVKSAAIDIAKVFYESLRSEGSGKDSSARCRYLRVVVQHMTSVLFSDDIGPILPMVNRFYAYGTFEMLCTSFEETVKWVGEIDATQLQYLQDDYLELFKLLIELSPSYLLVTPVSGGCVRLPNDGVVFVWKLQRQVLNAVFCLWYHPECSSASLKQLIPIIQKVYEGPKRSVTLNPDTVSSLESMGFSKFMITAAVEMVGNSVESAAGWLLNHNFSHEMNTVVEEEVEEEEEELPSVDDMVNSCLNLCVQHSDLEVNQFFEYFSNCYSNGSNRELVISCLINDSMRSLQKGDITRSGVVAYQLVQLLGEDKAHRSAIPFAAGCGIVGVILDILESSSTLSTTIVGKLIEALDFLTTSKVFLNGETINNSRDVDEIEPFLRCGGYLTKQEQTRAAVLMCKILWSGPPEMVLDPVIDLCSSLTKVHTVAVEFVEAGGLTAMLDIGDSGKLSQIIQHVLHDPQTLLRDMESRIRKDLKNRTCALQEFLIQSQALLFRDPVMFFQALTKVCVLERESGFIRLGTVQVDSTPKQSKQLISGILKAVPGSAPGSGSRLVKLLNLPGISKDVVLAIIDQGLTKCVIQTLQNMPEHSRRSSGTALTVLTRNWRERIIRSGLEEEVYGDETEEYEWNEETCFLEDEIEAAGELFLFYFQLSTLKKLSGNKHMELEDLPKKVEEIRRSLVDYDDLTTLVSLYSDCHIGSQALVDLCEALVDLCVDLDTWTALVYLLVEKLTVDDSALLLLLSKIAQQQKGEAALQSERLYKLCLLLAHERLSTGDTVRVQRIVENLSCVSQNLSGFFFNSLAAIASRYMQSDSEILSSKDALLRVLKTLDVIRNMSPKEKKVPEEMQHGLNRLQSLLLGTSEPNNKNLLPLFESYLILSSAEARANVWIWNKYRPVLIKLMTENPYGIGEYPLSMRGLDFQMKVSYLRQIAKPVTRETIRIDRNKLIEDSCSAILDFDGVTAARVKFVGESGRDHGGLTREWYQILSKAIFDERALLFTTAAGKESTKFQPNPNSIHQPHHLKYYRFAGHLVAMAIATGEHVDADFTSSFYKHILGRKITYHDFEAIDMDLYKNLVWLLKNNVDDSLGLTFSIGSPDLFGIVKDKELLPDGRNIPVTDENKLKYVELVTEYRLTKDIRSQIDAFVEGFYEVVSKDLISIFSVKELEFLVHGKQDINVAELREATSYVDFDRHSPVIVWLWEIVESFEQEDKERFLQFVTGSSKIPLRDFQLAIAAVYDSDKRLPSAHTCSRQLDLPEYKSKKQLQHYLLLAIREANVGFGFR